MHYITLCRTIADNEEEAYEFVRHGLGQFGVERIEQLLAIDTRDLRISRANVITLDVFANRSLDVIDVDGDDDPDLISASIVDNKIAWYENIGGEPLFSEQIIVDTTFGSAISLMGADIDGDGDQDILAAANSDQKVAWYQNLNGTGDFGSALNIATGIHVNDVFSTDVDGDGDLDVLAASYTEDKIAWYENLDGAGSFGDENVITTDVNGASCVSAADLDNDGDADLLTCSDLNSRVNWAENTDGQGSFGEMQLITNEYTGPSTVHPIDLDEDGDIDIVGASVNAGGAVFCLRNELIVTTISESWNPPQDLLLHSNYPNPFNPATTIQYQLLAGTHISLKVYDSLGREMITLVEEYQGAGQQAIQWDGTDKDSHPVGSGIYVSVLKIGSKVDARKMLLLR